MASAVMQISILIVSYNVREELARCLASLDAAADVVVVDNNSTDGSAAMVRQRFKHVTLIASRKNRGFSAAVNMAAARATGDALLLLNPDTELSPGSLARMGDALCRHCNVWAVGFRQVDARGKFQLAVGGRPTVAGELLRRALQRRLDGGSQLTARTLDWLLSKPCPVPWVAGSSLLVWRDAFDSVGGFDERYFLYFEDIDFCLRLGQAGGTVYYDPSITLLHHRGASAASARDIARVAYRDSQLRFWQAHRGPVMRRFVQGYLRLRGLRPGRDFATAQSAN